MKNLLVGIFILGLTSLSYSQASFEEANNLELEGITLMPANMTYLTEVSSGSKALRVINLQREAASHDVTQSDIYDGESNLYNVSFTQKDGQVLATYDKDGRILKTFEKYKDIVSPWPVRKSIYKAYPGWSVEGNRYVVSYNKGRDPVTFYKVKIEKGNKHKSVKIDSNGNMQ
ncbi:MAG: hypothetical protein WBN11_09430 [Eudoraea sp.]|uniref:hypothetical protein n=1 Tax=Eudoraea sp. TaxID=1979955 RepID=UPI003C773708